MLGDFLKFFGICVGAVLLVASTLLLLLFSVAWSFSSTSGPPSGPLTSETEPLRRAYTGQSNEWLAHEMDSELSWLLETDSGQDANKPLDEKAKDSGREALDSRLSIYEDSAARNSKLRERMAALDASIRQRGKEQAEAVKKSADQYERSMEQRKRTASQLSGSAFGRPDGSPTIGAGHGGPGARPGNTFRTR